MEWVRQHSNGSLIRCYRAIGPERSFRYVFSYLFRVLKFHHLPNTHTQSDPHDAKTLIRTKLKFSLPPSSLNSRKLLSVSPKDAEVDLKGRGDSLYLGKYRKIKIPFEITNAKFNWKTRRIEFLLQNDGLSNTRRVRSHSSAESEILRRKLKLKHQKTQVRFKGILGECRDTRKKRIVAHYGESELILTMGESKDIVEDWSHALDDRRDLILKDASELRTATLDEFFDFCTRDIAERIAQHASIDNRLIDLCDAMERKKDEMSVKQFLQRFVFPVCPAEWSKNKMRNIFKREFSQALKAYNGLKDEINDLDTSAGDVFSNVGVTRIEPGEELNRVLKEYAIDVRTCGVRALCSLTHPHLTRKSHNTHTHTHTQVQEVIIFSTAFCFSIISRFSMQCLFARDG